MINKIILDEAINLLVKDDFNEGVIGYYTLDDIKVFYKKMILNDYRISILNNYIKSDLKDGKIKRQFIRLVNKEILNRKLEAINKWCDYYDYNLDYDNAKCFIKDYEKFNGKNSAFKLIKNGKNTINTLRDYAY